jgi:hypothetical protein
MRTNHHANGTDVNAMDRDRHPRPRANNVVLRQQIIQAGLTHGCRSECSEIASRPSPDVNRAKIDRRSITYVLVRPADLLIGRFCGRNFPQHKLRRRPSTIASGSSRTRTPGDHGSAIAFGFLVLVFICLAAVAFLLAAPQEMGPLIRFHLMAGTVPVVSGSPSPSLPLFCLHTASSPDAQSKTRRVLIEQM